jgi:hypothetical protein
MHGAWGAAVRDYAGDHEPSDEGDITEAQDSLDGGPESDEDENRGRPRNKGEGSVRREECKRVPKDNPFMNLKTSPTIRNIHEDETRRRDDGDDLLEDGDLMRIHLADVDEEDGHLASETDEAAGM